VIWETLQQNVTEQDIVDAIMQRFDTTAEEAQADVRAFLEQMKAESLIVE
jgi:nucleoid DNA-binding protein